MVSNVKCVSTIVNTFCFCDQPVIEEELNLNNK